MKTGAAIRFAWMATVVCLLALAATGCRGDPRAFGEVQQPLDGGGDAATGGETNTDGSEAGENQEAGEGGIGLAAISCPTNAVPLKLAIAHQLNYSPNRMTDVYSVNASTDPNAWCMVTVAGSKVTAEPCRFTYHYEGFATDGQDVCQIAGDATAGLDITGRCQDGTLILKLREYAADDGLTGTMNCPGKAAIEYGTAYPPSQTEGRFVLATDGAVVSEYVERDVTSQFSYRKTWTLIVPPDVISMP